MTSQNSPYAIVIDREGSTESFSRVHRRDLISLKYKHLCYIKKYIHISMRIIHARHLYLFISNGSVYCDHYWPQTHRCSLSIGLTSLVNASRDHDWIDLSSLRKCHVRLRIWIGSEKSNRQRLRLSQMDWTISIIVFSGFIYIIR